MESDLDTIFGDDGKENDTTFQKNVASKYNDGYSDGLFAGSAKGFLNDFNSGFNMAYPSLMKLFQLKFTVDRCLTYYKCITFSEGDIKCLKILYDTLNIMLKVVKSNSIEDLKKKPNVKCDSSLQVETSLNLPLQAANAKLHEDADSTLTKEMLWKDLNAIYEYINNCKNQSCFRNTRVEDVLFTLKELLESVHEE